MSGFSRSKKGVDLSKAAEFISGAEKGPENKDVVELKPQSVASVQEGPETSVQEEWILL